MDKDYKVKAIKVPRFNEANGFYTTSKKSKAMSKIKGKNTKPEMVLRQVLWALNLRYRIHVKNLPGNPDILMRKHKLAIFIDGEFWHGYNWEKKKLTIKSNIDFWIPKIERNMQRDKENTQKLIDLGFKTLRFWEHEIKKDIDGCVLKILNHINNSELD